jgi:L-iditol 2-dehydrogenase
MSVAARSVRRGGRIVAVSVLDEDARLPVTLLRERGITLAHPASGAGGPPGTTVFDHALRLIARGDVDVGSLITHHLDGLDQLGHALEITGNKRKYGATSPAQVHTGHTWPGRRT